MARPMTATATLSYNDPQIMRARGLTVVHHIDEAEAAYREILKGYPDTAEALNFVAMCDLGRGDFATALERLEHALRLNPDEADIWKNLGIALLAQGRSQDAIDAFDRVLSMEPKSLAARLHRAAALERLGNTYEATAAYDCVLTMAQSGGRWRSAETTPPELDRVVRHAMSYVHRQRRRIFLDLMAPVRGQYGAGALERVEQGLAFYLDDATADHAAPQQGCSFFLVPGLSQAPFLDAAAIPGLDRLAAQRATLLTELDAARAAAAGVEPYFGTHDLDFLRRARALDGTDGARLEAFFLYRRGEPEPTGHRSCPLSVAAVDALPQPVRVSHLGPDVFFALIAPGTHVLKSTGITNARLSVEIPLQVDGECVRRVASAERAWREGECIAYDASFEHELCNRGGATSTALVLDAWHPGLSAAERSALALLFDGISEFNLAAHAELPFGA